MVFACCCRGIFVRITTARILTVVLLDAALSHALVDSSGWRAHAPTSTKSTLSCAQAVGMAAVSKGLVTVNRLRGGHAQDKGGGEEEWGDWFEKAWGVCALASLAAYQVKPGALSGEHVARGPRSFLQACSDSLHGAKMGDVAATSAEIASRLQVVTATQHWTLLTFCPPPTRDVQGLTSKEQNAEGVDILAWRGTDIRRLDDVLSDIDCLPTEVPDELLGHFHPGFLARARQLDYAWLLQRLQQPCTRSLLV